MSATQITRSTSEDRATVSREAGRRRDDVDHDLVAVLGMLAILALTALCFLGRSALPL